jgi:prepilin-type N-terminal cleavage/methylation domain-containing protein
VSRRDEGFTLVELLVSISILAVIMVPLSGAIILLLQNNGRTTNRIAAAHDEFMLSSYWPTDLQGATTLSTTDTASCPATVAGSSLVARLRSTDIDASNVVVTKVVAYYAVPASGSSDAQLLREYCDDAGSTGTLAVRNTVPVTHQLTGATVACFSSTGTNTTAAGCTPVTTATLTVTSTTAVTAVTLTGRRRSQ